jgi:hypothetical protein
MGASQSIISHDDFKNYLYGTTILMLAPRLDSELQFKECSQIKDEDKHTLPLVLSSQPSMNEIIDAYKNYYGHSGKEDAIDKYVTDHILDSNEHISEFMKQLFNLLQDRHGRVQAGVRRLAVKPSHNDGSKYQSSIRTRGSAGAPAPSSAAPAAPIRQDHSIRYDDTRVRSEQPAHKVPPRSESELEPHGQAPTHQVIRGHGKLLKKLQHVATAIDNEQAVYQANQANQEHEELIAVTSQNIAKSFQPPSPLEQDNMYDEHSTQDGSHDGEITNEHDVIVSDEGAK